MHQNTKNNYEKFQKVLHNFCFIINMFPFLTGRCQGNILNKVQFNEENTLPLAQAKY